MTKVKMSQYTLLFVVALCITVGAFHPASLSFARSGGKTNNRALAAESSLLGNFDYAKEEKLPWIESGYKFWEWNGYKINYLDLGNDKQEDKPPLLLIHGFGASAYHWRYNIPVLARKYRVYALDLLGFGLSSKPIIDYNADVWRDQVLAFIEEVVQSDSKGTSRGGCVVAGNSLGGYTALAAAAAPEAVSKGLVSGCILLNAAGRFRSAEDEAKPKKNPIVEYLSTAFQRFVINLSFIYTKQPARIEQVLRQVYPVNPANVDPDLVESIRVPSLDPNAAEVFFRVVSRNGNGPPTYVDDLLTQLKVPLLLLWGIEDPWIRPLFAEKIQALHPPARRVDVNAGHCPHDEAPEPVNKAISEFMQSVHKLSV